LGKEFLTILRGVLWFYEINAKISARSVVIHLIAGRLAAKVVEKCACTPFSG
jgi:hypothetical protein